MGRPEHRNLYFSGVLNVHGSPEDAQRRWDLVVGLLEALGCVDICLRETDIQTVPMHQWCERCLREILQQRVQRKP